MFTNKNTPSVFSIAAMAPLHTVSPPASSTSPRLSSTKHLMYSSVKSCSQEFPHHALLSCPVYPSAQLSPAVQYATRGNLEKKRRVRRKGERQERRMAEMQWEVTVGLAAESPKRSRVNLQDVPRSALLLLPPFFLPFLSLPNLTSQPAGQNRDLGHWINLLSLFLFFLF